jgi:predicted enzyme related to lactoylglutathione lyase
MDFNNILIGSDQPKVLIDYYTKLFGEPGMSDESYSGWAIGSGFIAVGAHSEVHGRNPSPGRLIWNISSTDVKGDYERFKAAGATVVTELYSMDGYPDMWIATFEDPDGNYFQLQTPFDPASM